MKQTITYQTLYDKLRSVGFTTTELRNNGTTRIVFRHPDIQNVYLDLPNTPEEAAANMHILAVRTILERHGFLDEHAWVNA